MFPIVTHYIPLCLYLYWMRWRQLLKNIHLHSTMLLLIRDRISSIDLTAEFTFHYASTYTKPDLTCQRYWSNLHSTMLLLIPSPVYLARILFSIYIPLCFYLYWHCFMFGIRIYHLHSTMLLLIRIMRKRKSSRLLTLHSTMLLLIRRGRNLPERDHKTLHSTMLLLIRIR